MKPVKGLKEAVTSVNTPHTLQALGAQMASAEFITYKPDVAVDMGKFMKCVAAVEKYVVAAEMEMAATTWVTWADWLYGGFAC